MLQFDEDFFEDFDYDDEDDVQYFLNNLFQPIVENQENLRDYGQRGTDWIETMDGFPSADWYNRKLQEFLVFYQNCLVDDNEMTMERGLLLFFDGKKAEKTSLGNARYKISVSNTWVSVFKKFWRFALKKSLSDILPMLFDRMSKWLKEDTPATQAKTFSTENLRNIYQLDFSIVIYLSKRMLLLRRQLLPEVAK